MSTITIGGVPITFPFEPYDIQKTYMEKVIDCLQNEHNGMLESPTGTGKTLSLLCSSLAWLEVKKAQLQAQDLLATPISNGVPILQSLQNELDANAGKGPSGRGHLPTIIYASRTHSQLSQAMQELKRTAYKHMKACVLGSRDQLCVHEDVMKEQSFSTKIQLCQAKVKGRTCLYYNKIESKKNDPQITGQTIMDIEDLVKLGTTHRFCPYFMAKELKQQADIVFMPYNYLLDPRVRKALSVELSNNIVILDEAHNIERICEDSASLQIKSTDITLCIEEITTVMKILMHESPMFVSMDVSKDFDADELCVFKQMVLDFEKQLDQIDLKPVGGATFNGNYIFDMFSRAGIKDNNFSIVASLLERLIQFLSTLGSEGPHQRKGNGLQLFSDMLMLAFSSTTPAFKEKIQKCYKLHVKVEETTYKKKGAENWLTNASITSGSNRILSFWCLSPGFGMNMLMEQGVRSVILTSGTLAPLQSLISELEINVKVCLENPHIVKSDQVCVKILSQGPDGEILNCNYQNRENKDYLRSLGQTIVNLCRFIPGGLLIFFPSYPIMYNIKQHWQQSPNSMWSSIDDQKKIFVEPRDKVLFKNVMAEYYARIEDTTKKGAIFMGVCRGKVSEGLDFADINGRAVIVVGLPYPPVKDARVILKRRYLDMCHVNNKTCLRGDDWYNLEATRAINQAIGRVIRHRYDYGAIILLDERFNNIRIKSQLSKWLQGHIKVVSAFGGIIRDLCQFFRNAQDTLPKLETIKSIGSESNVAVPAEFDISKVYKQSSNSEAGCSNNSAATTNTSLVNIHNKRNPDSDLSSIGKRKKITVIPNNNNSSVPNTNTSNKEFIIMVKKALEEDVFKMFVTGMSAYRDSSNFDDLKKKLSDIFLPRLHLKYIIQGLGLYLKEEHRAEYESYWSQL